MREQTLVIITHAGVQRQRLGATISALEQRGLKIVALRFLPAAPAAAGASATGLARAGLCAVAAALPVVVVAVEGDGAVAAAHRVVRGLGGVLEVPIAYAPASAVEAEADLALWLGKGAVAWASHSDGQLFEKAGAAAASAKPASGGRGGAKSAAASGAVQQGDIQKQCETPAEYLARHGVEALLNAALNKLVGTAPMPAQPYEWLAQHFMEQVDSEALRNGRKAAAPSPPPKSAPKSAPKEASGPKENGAANGGGKGGKPANVAANAAVAAPAPQKEPAVAAAVGEPAPPFWQPVSAVVPWNQTTQIAGNVWPPKAPLWD
mmetsp:Transcript_18060/g.46260  ORF Transcript_18060/g.46260 Transcript_18060/m.46260 type:complete len:321 (-) Transcript_18060:243-1205(-)